MTRPVVKNWIKMDRATGKLEHVTAAHVEIAVRENYTQPRVAMTVASRICPVQSPYASYWPDPEFDQEPERFDGLG